MTSSVSKSTPKPVAVKVSGASAGIQSADYKLEPDTQVWWSTPILRRTYDPAGDVCRALKALVLERAETGANVQKSNQGGWHSDEDLLSWGGPAIAQLSQWITAASQDMTTAISGGQVYRGKLELNAWANLNRTGQYNTMHTHPSCVWSGVFYVETGDRPTPSHPKSGVIEFLDPRAGAEMVITPGIPFGQAKVFIPENGQMIMFPSWMKHMVHPYWGQADRISIAFNVRLRPNL